MIRGRRRRADSAGARDGGVTVSPEWLPHQEQAGAVFKRLGCSVSIDAKVQGGRSNHRVDVLVRFSRWGLPQVWLIECKYFGELALSWRAELGR